MGRERRAPARTGGELLGRCSTTGRETTVKCCGVAVVMPQGPSRAPPSSSESQWTREPSRSYPWPCIRCGGSGWARRPPIGPGWGGAAV